jgi:hypothetical protein
MAAVNPSAAPKMRSLLVQNAIFAADQIHLTLNHVHDEIAFILSILHLKPKFLVLFTDANTAAQIRVAFLRNMETDKLVAGMWLIITLILC